MTQTILGLDIGGANLKAATICGMAVSVPFALWKQPEELPAMLAKVIARFPESDLLAVTMTGELCDCFETKRSGVRCIVDTVERIAGGRPTRYWSTDGEFLNAVDARNRYLKVAAANWHALATYAGREFAPIHGGLLIDIGSTTSDLIPLNSGVPATFGSTDPERLKFRELVYTGVKRTPVCAVVSDRVAAELFATMLDVHVLLGDIPEAEDDVDTADGRPRTRQHSCWRLARMLGHDNETFGEDELHLFAEMAAKRQLELLVTSARAAYFDDQSPPELRTIVVSGSGEFLARRVARAFMESNPRVISLSERWGADCSSAAPAYAVAMLAKDRTE